MAQRVVESTRNMRQAERPVWAWHLGAKLASFRTATFRMNVLLRSQGLKTKQKGSQREENSKQSSALCPSVCILTTYGKSLDGFE
jgi:hypothetical protein